MATTEGIAPAAEKATASHAPEQPAAEDAAMADTGLADDDNEAEAEAEADAEADAGTDADAGISEAPGPRAARLQTLFASSLQHTLAKVSWANFAACYPTAAARSPAALQTVHAALVARLRELCEAEFAAVLRARDVVRKLNALEQLAEAAARRRLEAAAAAAAAAGGPSPVPPHTLPPERILAAHLRPQRRAQRALLEARLRSTQAANAARFAQLAAQQAEAARLVGRLEQALADAAAAAALLEGKEEGGAATAAAAAAADGDELVTVLARETRAAEVAMSGM